MATSLETGIFGLSKVPRVMNFVTTQLVEHRDCKTFLGS
jgi:hypothetical protein